jgi:hypothetical protein
MQVEFTSEDQATGKQYISAEGALAFDIVNLLIQLTIMQVEFISEDQATGEQYISRGCPGLRHCKPFDKITFMQVEFTPEDQASGGAVYQQRVPWPLTLSTF